MASRQFALQLLLCGQPGVQPLQGYLARYMRKSHRDRQARRVHTVASCSTITAKDCFDFFVACQISPRGAFFDDLPLVVGDIVCGAPLLKLPDKTRDFFLILLRPGQHPIENVLHLLFGHDAIIQYRHEMNTARIRSMAPSDSTPTAPSTRDPDPARDSASSEASAHRKSNWRRPKSTTPGSPRSCPRGRRRGAPWNAA